ncbi:hypothetical protein CMZ82_15395 [Lysobacteraceae bacterium NML93-0792]|nr:hypothetical protein CMZ82_15395 [Xanthomonadaceae bacterium NML93-0792]PBS14498.1 hypothetical protein CMZ81_15645 [Xanthomonadaceae bacterium NML93-0793]PBS19503.1 hypothetical protein CMZ80_07410 [Xanthomonadaceae bacterium NML93-0831]
MSATWHPAALGLALGVTALLSGPLPASAEPTVIYRCTAPDGEVIFQNGTPCTAGHQQQRRVIDIAAPLPAFVPAPPAPERVPAVPSISTLPAAVPATPDADGEALAKSPPPALYSCRVYDNSTYWREDDAPPARCRPLQTVGIGGVPGMGAGEACERHEDVCTAVPADDLCRAWDARVREAEFRWRFGDSGTRESAGVEYERLFKQLQASACAT